MEEPVSAKDSFESFDSDFLKGFDTKGKLEDVDAHCASTQACTDYQKVNFHHDFETKVIFYVKKKNFKIHSIYLLTNFLN